MRRWSRHLLVFSCVLAIAQGAQAAKRNSTHRYQRGSFAEYIVRKDHNGQRQVREVYNGYSSGFPPLGFWFYGAPHALPANGIGFNSAQGTGF